MWKCCAEVPQIKLETIMSLSKIAVKCHTISRVNTV